MLSEAIREIDIRDKDDKKILIRGYGEISLSVAKRKIQARINDANDAIDNNNWNNLYSILYGDGILQAIIKEIINQEK